MCVLILCLRGRSFSIDTRLLHLRLWLHFIVCSVASENQDLMKTVQPTLKLILVLKKKKTFIVQTS